MTLMQPRHPLTSGMVGVAVGVVQLLVSYIPCLSVSGRITKTTHVVSRRCYVTCLVMTKTHARAGAG